MVICVCAVKLHVYKDFLVISEPVFGAVAIPNKDVQSQLYNNEVSSVQRGKWWVRREKSEEGKCGEEWSGEE